MRCSLIFKPSQIYEDVLCILATTDRIRSIHFPKAVTLIVQFSYIIECIYNIYSHILICINVEQISFLFCSLSPWSLTHYSPSHCLISADSYKRNLNWAFRSDLINDGVLDWPFKEKIVWILQMKIVLFSITANPWCKTVLYPAIQYWASWWTPLLRQCPFALYKSLKRAFDRPC